jgi:hypothetical protein
MFFDARKRMYLVYPFKDGSFLHLVPKPHKLKPAVFRYDWWSLVDDSVMGL